jgi:cysteine desulfurase
LVSAIEHTSVLSGGRFQADAIAAIKATGASVVDLDHLRTLLADGPPALVSVMLANNETGAIQPVAEVADIVHRAGGLLHVDAIQALGKIPFDIRSRRAGTRTAGRHRECGWRRGLWRRRTGRHGRAGRRCRPTAGPA